MGGLSIWHWLVVGILIILLFGRGRFSAMMGDVASGIRRFRTGMSEEEPAAPAKAEMPIPAPVHLLEVTAIQADEAAPPQADAMFHTNHGHTLGAEATFVKASEDEMGDPVSADDDGRSLPVWDVLDTPRPPPERVAEARRLLGLAATYPRGCSEFMCAVLGIAFEQANDLMGAAPGSLGSRPPYAGLTLGDVVGWKDATGSGHVALYVNASASPLFADMFIDVRAPGARPRLKNGFYDREIFQSSRF